MQRQSVLTPLTATVGSGGGSVRVTVRNDGQPGWPTSMNGISSFIITTPAEIIASIGTPIRPAARASTNGPSAEFIAMRRR